jgi:transcriptional regulator with XRE-family HTH domain
LITPTHDRAQAVIEVKPHISYEAATSAVEEIDRLLDEHMLSHIEAGHANPTWATARDIAAALGASITELAKLSEKHE